MVYVIDRSDSGIIGSREYWTTEFGMIDGRYDQGEDYLVGCVIDGIVYGDTTVTGIDERENAPEEFVLYQNYPNPFNPSTTISWQVGKGGNVSLKLYDILGRDIRALINKYYSPGYYSLTFNFNGLPSGVYFYKLKLNNFIQTKKMILMR